jgi:hypothetical protein
VHDYSHEQGGCSVTGGYVSRHGGSALDGVYVFSDYCAGGVQGLRRTDGGRWESALLAPLDGLVTTFGQGDDGRLYVAANVDGWRVFALAGPPGLPELPFRVVAPGTAADR